MSDVIQFQNVTKRYGSTTALNDVSFAVPRGVVFALLGENGAGKTTAIRLMLGLTEATAGSVHVLGLDSRQNGQIIRERIGYLSERPALYEWMTAVEIGWFTAGFYTNGYEFRYRELLTGFRVPFNRKLSQLSKGMRAKVVLSLAMAHRPELLVLDEPTSGLDTLVRREFLESMVDVAAEGRTVLLSSHQISEVERVADYVAIVHAGHLITVDRLDELKQTTRQLTITVEDARTSMPAVDGEVINQRLRGRQWEMIVRDLEPAAIERVRFANGVVAVESRTPSLEEIFVAYVATPIAITPASPVTVNPIESSIDT